MFSDIRNRAKDIFSQIGYPSKKEEMWKYTNISNFNNCMSDNSNKSDYKLSDSSFLKESFNIIISNGQLISQDTKIDGVTIKSYKEIADSSTYEGKFLQLSDFTNSGVIAHNTAAFSDALHITIESNQIYGGNLFLNSNTNTYETDLTVTAKNATGGSQASVPITFSIDSGGGYFHSSSGL